MNWQDRLSRDLAPVWRAVHERLGSGRPVSRVQVGPLSDREQAALADLLGLGRLPGERPMVAVARLDEMLGKALGVGVHEVVTTLVGPIGDRAADRREANDRRARLWAWLDGHPVVLAQPALTRWAADVRRTGLIDGSTTRTRDVLDAALRVLAELPTSGTPLPVLAERVLHDPHGLDDGTRIARLVLAGLAAIYDLSCAEDTGQRRALWQRAGVTGDELSSLVLAAGLRPTSADPTGADPTAAVLRVCADAGQAAALTLAQLRRARWARTAPHSVYVVENPSVLALAVHRFGVRCPPLVCTSGWPSGAGVLLMRTLADTGAGLRYHGDFDGEGLRIAANVLAATGATPWRMSTADYRAAVAHARSGPPVGRVTEAPWDPELAAALRSTNVTISEERVADELLDELTH